MQSKSTFILGAITVAIIAIAVVAGIATQQPQQPAPQATEQTKPLPSAAELEKKRVSEQPAIILAITEAYPQLLTSYVINPGKLYHDGQWYGTTLTYYGQDEMNRDTLRLLVQKKDGKWQVRSKPPQIILRVANYPDAPKDVIRDINRPAPLPGTATSPAIN